MGAKLLLWSVGVQSCIPSSIHRIETACYFLLPIEPYARLVGAVSCRQDGILGFRKKHRHTKDMIV